MHLVFARDLKQCEFIVKFDLSFEHFKKKMRIEIENTFCKFYNITLGSICYEMHLRIQTYAKQIRTNFRTHAKNQSPKCLALIVARCFY